MTVSSASRAISAVGLAEFRVNNSDKSYRRLLLSSFDRCDKWYRFQ